MELKALKTYFQNALLGYYPDTEIQSFFYLLSEDVLGYKRIDVSLNSTNIIQGNHYSKFHEAIERLQQYEPIQYILGETEFYGMKFHVNRSVLIPRPETEELVDWILKEVKEKSDKKKLRILDIGTGSGCISVSLAKHLPYAEVFALDVSQEALKVASKNAELNDVEVTFIEADILNAEFSTFEKKSNFDIIVSNPPYVRELEKSMMKANVLKHEPHLALFVEDTDALLFYRKITQLAEDILDESGQLYFEINEYLGEETKSLMEKLGFKTVELKSDIYNKDRMIKGVRL